MVSMDCSPYLKAVNTLTGGHDESVWQVKFSPNGNYLASCSTDRSVCIWKRPKSLEGKWQISAKLTGVHMKTVRAVVWSPCGRFLASAGFDGTVCLWERDSETGEFDQCALLEGHESEVKDLSWSPNGELVASCSRDRTICIWGREIDEINGVVDNQFECVEMLSSAHSQDVKCVAFHPGDSTLLASGGYDDAVCISQEENDGSGTWSTEQTLQGHTSTVWSVAFAPDHNNRLASASADGTVRLWLRNSENNEFGLEGVLRVRQSLPPSSVSEIGQNESSPLYDISWSPNGRLLAVVSGGCDRRLRVYAVAPAGSSKESIFSPEPIAQTILKYDPNCCQFMPSDNEDELVIAVASDQSDIAMFRLENINWGELF